MDRSVTIGLVVPNTLLDRIDEEVRSRRITRSRLIATILAEELGIDVGEIRGPGRPSLTKKVEE